MKQKRKPHLRVAVTQKCNFNCVHCRPGGEGTPSNFPLITRQDITNIIKLASEVGFRHIKFTGGEPTLRKDLIKIILECREIVNLEDVQLVTNASLLTKKYAHKLMKSGINSLTVSLNAVTPEKFYEITGRNNIKEVIKGIYFARDAGPPITINSVIIQENKEEIEKLIEIAKKTGSRIKFLDYIRVTDSGWEDHYFPFSNLRESLERKAKSTKWIYPPGGLGTPMPIYKMDGVDVVIKDATIGTNYHNSCKQCSNYPCQDALISLRITHDGRLKKCLIRDDNLVDIITPLRRGDKEKAKELIKDMYKLFEESEYVPNAWKPETEKARPFLQR